MSESSKSQEGGDRLADPERRLRAFAATARVDWTTGEVARAMLCAAVRAILLKGPSTVRWLYAPDEVRRYTDTDLLIAPAERRGAERVLRQLGFRRLESGLLRIVQPSHGWRRHGVVVDLHTTLTGIGVSEQRAWAVLSRETSHMSVAGVDVEVLAPKSRALHLVLHAAQHPADGPRPADEVGRAIAELPHEHWWEVLELARELHAMPAFRTGLSLTPSGVELLAQLGLRPLLTPLAALRLGHSPPASLGVAELLAARAPRAAVGALLLSLFPPVEEMQRRSALARRGRTGLIAAYCSRALVKLFHVPHALRAWHRARKDGLGPAGPV